MPKIKTHKTTAKRFKLSGTGKIMRMKGGGLGGRTHLRRRRSQRAKYLFDDVIPVETKGDRKRIERLVPYLKEKKR